LLAAPGKRWDTCLKYALPSSNSSEEFSRGESKQHVKEDWSVEKRKGKWQACRKKTSVSGTKEEKEYTRYKRKVRDLERALLSLCQAWLL
jgi:hypothetical protein